MTPEKVVSGSQDFELKTYESEDGIKAFTLGRLLVLKDENFGEAYFVDVTDVLDPTTGDPENTETWHEVKLHFIEEINQNIEGFSSNNGVVVLITGRYEQKPRVFVGLSTADPKDESELDQTRIIAFRAGFQPIQSNVPMSYDGIEIAKQVVLAEFAAARNEIQELGCEDLLDQLAQNEPGY